MDKTKKAKLLELRQKKLATKQESESKRHTEFLASLSALHELFSNTSDKNAKTTDQILEKLAEFDSFKNEVTEVKKAINNIPKTDKVTIENVEDIIGLQQEVDLSEVTKSINDLTKTVQEQKIDLITIQNKKAEEYIPTRRVIEKQGRLVFDDKPMEVTVVGGGGGAVLGGMSSLQAYDTSGVLRNITAVESTATPGVWGIVVLTSTGGDISGGGGTTPVDTDNLLLENGDALLLENGDKLLLESE